MASEPCALDLLLKASSKTQVSEVCTQAFLHRNQVPQRCVEGVADTLGTSVGDTKQMFIVLRRVIKSVLFEGSTDVANVKSLIPASTNGNLKKLLSEIIVQNAPQWRSSLIQQQASLPQLLDFDWRVDVKTSSDSLSRMATPTCLLQMQIQEPASDLGSLPPVNNVTVELSKETLDAMLDGLGAIRDQLASVAKS